MSLEDRVKATAKNLEGKAQEALGEVTGDPEQKLEGQKKQAEAEVQQSVENLKDKAKKMID
ncbi:MAG: CsbD family protein [Cyanobacteriota bacterium]|nr:CsbD family protein [Cyanobacteriota bacterium]